MRIRKKSIMITPPLNKDVKKVTLFYFTVNTINMRGSIIPRAGVCLTECYPQQTKTFVKIMIELNKQEKKYKKNL